MAHSARLLGIVTGILCVGILGSVAPATIIVDEVTELNNLSVYWSIADIQAAGGIQMGDKLFDTFSVNTSESVNAIAPEAGEINVTAIKVGGDYGMLINSGWSAPAGQLAASTIRFCVTIQEPSLSEGWVLTDNTLWMTSFGVSNDTDAGSASVSEVVFAADPMTPGTDPIATKKIYYVSDTEKYLTDHEDFFGPSGPVQVPKIWVRLGVQAYGGVGTVGHASLNEFSVTFSQIPEPGTIALLATGGVFVLVKRRRRKS